MVASSGMRAMLLLGAVVAGSGTAWAQSSSQYDYSAQNDSSTVSEEWQADPADSQRGRFSSRAESEEDFSDVVASDERKEQAPSSRSTDAETEPSLRYEDSEAGKVTDACAVAARDEAERDGGYAEVRQMGEPRESRNGFIIDGDVDVRSGWRAQDGRLRHFSCTVANGRIEDIYFQRDRADR